MFPPPLVIAPANDAIVDDDAPVDEDIMYVVVDASITVSHAVD